MFRDLLLKLRSRKVEDQKEFDVTRAWKTLRQAENTRDLKLVRELALEAADVVLKGPKKYAWHHITPIWRALIATGEIDDALRLAESCSPNAPSDEFGDQRSGQQIDFNRRVAILDPGFVRRTGHHPNTVDFYTNMLNNLDYSVKCYGGVDKRQIKTDEISAVKIFSTPVYEGNTFDGFDSNYIYNINMYFERELNVFKFYENNKIFILHSIRYTSILGLSQWLLNNEDDKSRVVIIGIIDKELGQSENRNFHVIQNVYEKALSSFSHLKRTKILIYSETKNHVDFLQNGVGSNVEIAHFPYLPAGPGHGSEPKTVNDTGENQQVQKELTVGFIGDSRTERGSHLIPEIAPRFPYKKSIRWLVQITDSFLASNCKEDDIEAFQKMENITLFHERLSNADYHKVLKEIDILLLPYSTRYEVSGSGIFFEGLSNAKVMVLPSSGWMIDTLTANGGKASVFEEQSVFSILNAIKLAIDNFPEQKTAANLAAEKWNKNNGAVEFLENWLKTCAQD